MFEELASLAGDADRLFTELGGQLAKAGKFHELFDARLAQSRLRLGLPVDRTAGLDDLPEPLRSNLEEAYLSACREVGQLLVEAGRFREAWMYLRPAGDKQPIREALEKTVPNEESIEELIHIALHEGVAVERGLGWMLGHYGTCNSITTFEGLAGAMTLEDQRACATVLVRHLSDEVTKNVIAHVERQEGKLPPEQSLGDIISTRAWLFENGNYHTDTSHLASVVRFARLAEASDTLELAVDLAEYGRRLSAHLQYPGDPPFTDLYASHRLLFLATLGRQVDEAIDYFRRQAEETPVAEHGTGAIETYLIVLCRADRYQDAIDAYAELVPNDGSLSPYAPTLWHLAEQSGDWERYFSVTRERDDPVGFALGQLQQSQQST